MFLEPTSQNRISLKQQQLQQLMEHKQQHKQHKHKQQHQKRKQPTPQNHFNPIWPIPKNLNLPQPQPPHHPYHPPPHQRISQKPSKHPHQPPNQWKKAYTLSRSQCSRLITNLSSLSSSIQASKAHFDVLTSWFCLFLIILIILNLLLQLFLNDMLKYKYYFIFFI